MIHKLKQPILNEIKLEILNQKAKLKAEGIITGARF